MSTNHLFDEGDRGGVTGDAAFIATALANPTHISFHWLPEHGADPQARLPSDAMTWLQIEPNTKSGFTNQIKRLLGASVLNRPFS